MKMFSAINIKIEITIGIKWTICFFQTYQLNFVFLKINQYKDYYQVFTNTLRCLGSGYKILSNS